MQLFFHLVSKSKLPSGSMFSIELNGRHVNSAQKNVVRPIFRITRCIAGAAVIYVSTHSVEWVFLNWLIK